MDDINEILETLKTNREISQKFFEIETNILSILNFKDLFHRLLTEIQEKFGVPFVWISMIAKSDVSNLILELGNSEILKERLNLMDKVAFLDRIQSSKKPLLINTNLERFHMLFPRGQEYPLGSLAIAPLTLGGQVIGSLNQGDYSELRYTPGMDTTLLEQLSVKVSICISNVMAHERLRAMARVLEREFKRTERYGTPLSVAFLDVDDFKAVNDRYGHDMGDDVLKYVSTCLLEMTREIDIVARFAGDEFVIILPNTTLKQAHKFVERHQAFFRKRPMKSAAISVPVSVSAGVAAKEDAGITDATALLKKADQMLYQAKELKKKRNDPTHHRTTHR